MKKMNQNKYYLLLLSIVFVAMSNKAAAQDDSVKPTSIVSLRYFNINNSTQYLLLKSVSKLGRVLTPQENKTYDIYLDSSVQNNFIGKVTTDEKGLAKAIIPPALASRWQSSPQHTFVVKEGDEEVISDYTIHKAKISLDTSTVDGVKNITATVMQLDENNEWVPVPDVEMAIGVKRMNSILPAGDDPTYTTDSTGTATAELKKDSLPGDEKGNLVIAAKVEDNDAVGNLRIEETVPWGVRTVVDRSFFKQRTLWSTRFRTPFWLLFTVYGIVIGVWGTLLYLVFNLVKIGKIGKKTAIEKPVTEEEESVLV
jgi:hypothetical protein